MQVQDALTSRYSCTLLKHREISFQSNYAGLPALHPVYLFIATIFGVAIPLEYSGHAAVVQG